MNGKPERAGLLTILLLSYQSSQRLRGAARKVTEVMEQEGIEYELLIMDDGSTDDSYDIACELEDADNRIRAYRLSRNFTSHYSIFAGLSVCNGSCVTMIPDDDQQPLQVVVRMYRLWQQGHQVIVPYRESRDDDFISKGLSSMFYHFMNRFSDISFPLGGADSFFVDREIIDIINQRIHPVRTTVISEILRLGFDPLFLPYNRPEGNNRKSRWTFRKKWRLALDFFFSSSSFPIKLITNMGLVFSSLALLLLLAYLFIYFYGDAAWWGLDKVQGWMSIVFFIVFFSGLILFSLGIIAEYIWRIYEEVKARPGYIIRKRTEKKN